MSVAWTHYQSTETNQGDKFFYRCKDRNCQVKIQLFSNGLHVTLSIVNDHNHIGAPVTNKIQSIGIPSTTKEKIEELREFGLMPKQILTEIRVNGFGLPTTRQLSNFLVQIKKKNSAPIKCH